MWHNVTCQGLFGGYIVSGSTAFQRSKGKLYAETFRCPGGALCLDFCNSGAGAREDLSIIEAEHARAVSFARLAWTGEGYSWSLDPSAAALDAAMQPLVESAVGLLTSAKLERLRRCGKSTCYWLFIDETRNHSRRWCEMASCGNVVKVRRHREKARSAAH